MRRILALALLGLLAYGAFLVATLPAEVAVARLQRPGLLEWSEARGTVWRGSARVRATLPSGALEVDALTWRFAPARLLAARLAFDVEATGPGLEARGELARGLAGIEAREVRARGDARLLALAAPLLGTWRPQGTLTLAAPLLTWDERELRGSARGEWQGATLSLPDPQPLGTYVAEFNADGGPAKVKVSTTEGTLRIAADGAFTPPTRFALRGEARAEGPGAQAIAPLLDLLGPRRPDGARAIDWRTP
jgi:hypothetical protein